MPWHGKKKYRRSKNEHYLRYQNPVISAADVAAVRLRRDHRWSRRTGEQAEKPSDYQAPLRR